MSRNTVGMSGGFALAALFSSPVHAQLGWSEAFGNQCSPFSGFVSDLVVFDDGTGLALYASGVTSGGIAKWDGSHWTGLGSGVSGTIDALLVFGGELYVGGDFSMAGGVPANNVAKWNGTTWSALGSGVGTAPGDKVTSLAVYGGSLYAGAVATVSVEHRFAKWDGANWLLLGSGVNNHVRCMEVFQNLLYVGGQFNSIGGMTGFDHIAAWDGSDWITVIPGFDDDVTELFVFDDGFQVALYAGGYFTSPAPGIAKWNGVNWSGLGVGLNGPAHAIGAYDSGTGSALYAGGQFNAFGTDPPGPGAFIAKWDGVNWETLNGTFDSWVSSLAAFNDGTGASLFVGGLFSQIDGIDSDHIAKWGPITSNPLAPLLIVTYPHSAAKQRYVSFAPHSSHTATAFRVTDVGSGAAYYICDPVSSPASVIGQGVTFLGSDTCPTFRDWSSLPQVHVGGCMVAPGDSTSSPTGRAYEVMATADGVNFSPALTVMTAARPTNSRFWSDIVGLFSVPGSGATTPPTPPNSWEPPNRNMSGFDISAALQGAATSPTRPHFTWGDINPELTDRVTNGPDTLRVVNAFGTGTGKEFYPFAYPQLPCAIHHPSTPPAPALCPTPPPCP